MDIAAIILTSTIAIVIIAKFYNMFSTVRKKGLKGFLIQKGIMLSIVAVIFGAYVLINPDSEIINPKKVVTDYIYQMLD